MGVFPFYGPVHKNGQDQTCYYVDFTRQVAREEIDILEWLIASEGTLSFTPAFSDNRVVEIGPRLSVETPFSSNAVAIFQSMGLPVRRIETSIRYWVDEKVNAAAIRAGHLDPMTQQVYESTLTTFDSGIQPEPVRFVDILARGSDALHEENKKLGLGMDEADIVYYSSMFQKLGRNPTDVEMMQVGNANSEHSRHWFFRGMQVIDGIEMLETLMDIVKAPLKLSGDNSLVAFHDNAGVIRGCKVEVFLPKIPGQPSTFHTVKLLQHITATAETHNHPTMIAPFPGAETGAGGRIRDNRAVGRGGLTHVGFAGYCVGNLHLPDFEIPGEKLPDSTMPKHYFTENLASPLDILIKGSNGVSDYGNKIGEPLIGGFCLSFGQMVNGVRREFRKPVLYSAGLGRIFDPHVKKYSPEMGMLIVRIGGPAYRIGVGGGAASSMAAGQNDAALDLKSVQRGNAEMENRVNRVIQTCAEMLEDNPVESIHDQGAGGPSNVLTELMEPIGGKVDIRKITVGDNTMSVLELWVAEFQEGYGLLIKPESLEGFEALCRRERVNCEVLGEITGNGNVVVYDSTDNTTPVNLSLADILGELPQKRFPSSHVPTVFEPLVIPSDLTIAEALQKVFRLLSVGSKGFLTRKVDRSVTGLVARQQCCGPMQVPVANAAVTADGFFGLTGAATARGLCPNIMLISPKAGSRMSVARMTTNLASVGVNTLRDVKCRANWMWAAKREGEGALLYDAAVSMRDIMLELGIAIDGGKDSLSMATMVGDEVAVSPGVLVVMGYAPVPDITKVVTPDLKGNGRIGFLGLGKGKSRLGGSALAQALGQLGNECPDIDDADLLRRAFCAMQELIEKDLITAYHDVSDGGFITAIAEMCIAGNWGALIELPSDADAVSWLFSEESGMVFEYQVSQLEKITGIFEAYDLQWVRAGLSYGKDSPHRLQIRHIHGSNYIFDHELSTLRVWWEATSTELEKRQANPETVEAEHKSHTDMRVLEYKLSFVPAAPNLLQTRLYKVAVLREEGTNGDREMAAAFYTAGLEPIDVNMQDLLDGRVSSFDMFRGIVYPGGFSYADVFGSAKGWAGPIRFNPVLKEMFERFYDREDTFSLGVCNGCQHMANIGVLPYRGIPDSSQPRLVHNVSGRFESRWVGVKIFPSPSIFFTGMEGSLLGINVAHGEGRFVFPDPQIAEEVGKMHLRPLAYVDPDGKPTETYPYNPNGSPLGLAAICSLDGRHLAMMPHPERSFLKWHWPWMPDTLRNLEASPWLQMFVNARDWCNKN